MIQHPRASLVVAVLLLLIPCAPLFDPLLGRAAFVPADLLEHVAPWKSPTPTCAWNVLRFDGITQFYPWRLLAAKQWHQGQLPLWNPYAFAAEGGTPLLANSQSAPLYPLNLLFALMPTRWFWYAFGLSVALHLLIAALGVYRFARRLGIDRLAALLSAVTFAWSAPILTWLALPSFLAVTCWLPWILLAIHNCHRPADSVPRRYQIARLGTALGLSLLAGHLQMGFYVLLSAGLYAVWQGRPRSPRWLVGAAAALVLGVALATPQILPSIELSRVSHRAAAARPSVEGYRAYNASAFPLRNLVTLAVPDFFGHPNTGNHWNDSAVGTLGGPHGNNYAEWAIYLGIAPLLLALSALFLPWRVNEPAFLRTRRFLTVLLGLSVSMAAGTPVNAFFYFVVPGFSQTGNPARILAIIAFTLALLAGIGLQGLTCDTWSARERRRAVGMALTTLALLAAVGAALAQGFARAALPQVGYAQLLAIATPSLQLALVWTVLAGGLLLALPTLTPTARPLGAALAIVVTSADLLIWGAGYNPTAPPSAVYPLTPGIAWLQTHGANALIAPLNRTWSLGGASPPAAVLPPNSLSVFGLHDIAGYDSLFPGDAKRRLAEATGEDPCPPENGNLVFVKSVAAARAVGARFLVTTPEHRMEDPDLRLVYQGPDLWIFETPDGKEAPPPPRYAPTSLRAGLFLAGIALATLLALRLPRRPSV